MRNVLGCGHRCRRQRHGVTVHARSRLRRLPARRSGQERRGGCAFDPAAEAGRQEADTSRPRWRQVATTVSIRSTYRLPTSLSVPWLVFRQITPCRSPARPRCCPAAPPPTAANVHRWPRPRADSGTPSPSTAQGRPPPRSSGRTIGLAPRRRTGGSGGARTGIVPPTRRTPARTAPRASGRRPRRRPRDRSWTGNRCGDGPSTLGGWERARRSGTGPR